MANKSIKSRAALVKALQDVTEDAPAALMVKVGGTIYTVAGAGTYIGVAAGKDYAALTIGDDTMLLGIDHKSGGGTKTARLISSVDADKIAAIATDMLPVPEPPKPPDEALAALEALSNLSGFKIAVDSKGKVSLVPTDEKPKRTRAKKGEAEPKVPTQPLTIEVGKKIKSIKGKEEGNVYVIKSIELSTGYVILETEAGEELPNPRRKMLKGNGLKEYGNVLKQYWTNV